MVRIERPEVNGLRTADSLGKLWCWSLGAWDKCVFLDASSLLLSPADDLFLHPQLAAIPAQSKTATFLTNLFVYKPSNGTFEQLIGLAEKLRYGKTHHTTAHQTPCN